MKTSKVILISGGNSGLGRITANELASEGHTVYAGMRDTLDRNRESKLTTEAEAKKKGIDIRVINLDVTRNESVISAVSHIIEESKKIDVLINNAGVMNAGITEGFTISQAQEQFEVNFFGSIRTCKAVLPFMRKRKTGLLVQVSSLAGRAVFPFFGIYCASKFAVEALAEAYRYELKSFGIDSIIIEPGPFATEIFKSSPRPKDKNVLSQYGEHNNFPDLLLNNFEKAANHESAPKPLMVAKAISRLINEKSQNRPTRTIVSGSDFNINALNKAAIPIQEGVIKAMGLDFMLNN